MKSLRLVQIFIVLIALSACDRDADGSRASSTTSVDPVLAKVGDTSIHQSQLDVMMDRLSPEIREQKNEQLEKTILQGLVRTRALAGVAETQLSEVEEKQLDAKVLSFRDELLAQSYVRKNITPQPVTTEMVGQYYREHQEEYATAGVVNFEYMVTVSEKLDDGSMSQVLDAFSKAKNIDDWQRYVTGLKEKNIAVEYQSASLTPLSISKVLRTHIDKLKAGEVSDLIYGDYIYVARVITREPDMVKPMHEVSINIRKKLAPQKLKQVLSQHVDKALQDINVEYMK